MNPTTFWHFGNNKNYSVNIDADYLVIIYEFTDGKDLDTRTRIVSPDIGQEELINCIGYDCQDSFKNILIWGGDNQGKGFESVLIDFNELKKQYPEKENISIEGRAFWWNNEIGRNPVKMFCKFYKGGKMINTNFLWKNPTAKETTEYRSIGKIITTKDKIGDRISVLNYNLKTKVGYFNDNDKTTPAPF